MSDALPSSPAPYLRDKPPLAAAAGLEEAGMYYLCVSAEKRSLPLVIVLLEETNIRVSAGETCCEWKNPLKHVRNVS